MKTRNFPARQIAADLRTRFSGPSHSITARELYREDVGRDGALSAARRQRSKLRGRV